ncbi:Ig-like domain-containing protein [Aequorivita echinoideorum]|uniref:Ig-like domain-containing protein n=1 Tax=Aequorivita echinoideorum TaxID=1549647 RepID=UPI001BD921E1|nr:Ig-like domain-containing protein [Aequorivita echinoideorum]
MKHRLLLFFISFLFMLSFMDCAKKGTPDGGARDTIPPVIVRSIPENYSTNFSGDEIEIRFDEYIKLKDVNRELIISPPLKYTPVITPLNTSRILKIKILDTLKPNTTYSFNFGNSIVDNNEENKFEYFKYVFSTGSYIDSLKLSGRVRDAELVAPEIPTTVLLYEANETFTDSLIYSEKPTYITVTKDSTGTFEFSNLKEGQYLLLALKEKNSDYIFQPQNDKIGFVSDFVTLPTDSTYTVTLFKELPEYSLARPKQEAKNHMTFGYYGPEDSLAVEVLSTVPPDFESRTYNERNKDTLHYWYKPPIETDSITFKVTSRNQIDTTTIRMRELYADSLKFGSLGSASIKLNDTIKLSANTPLVSVNAEKVEVMAKDSTFISAEIKIDSKYNTANIFFPKREDQSYSVRLYPGAITDFFGKENDTLKYSLATKSASDYGTMALTLNNVNRFPIIVQLTNSKYEVVAEKYLTENQNILFEALNPDKYYLRIIYDDNGNGRWDTGNFLNRLSPERIIYYPKQIEVRANWSLNETFTLK